MVYPCANSRGTRAGCICAPRAVAGMGSPLMLEYQKSGVAHTDYHAIPLSGLQLREPFGDFE